jgi:uncharacterized SAM-binding protein YcdF (DUF218 family)
VKHVLSAAFLPPTGLALLVCFCGLGAAMVPARRWRKLCRAVIWLAMIGLVALAVPFVGRTMLGPLEADLPRPPPDFQPQAIVVLAGDEHMLQGQGGRAEVGAMTLERLRYAAREQHRTGLPVLTSGAIPWAGETPLATLMAESLRQDFGVPVRWVEDASLDTWQNAQFSAAILRADDVTRVLLVTHPWHMRRSLLAFARAGVQAYPADMPLDREPSLAPYNLVPREEGWAISYTALHEWIGLVYYTLR